MKKLMYLAAIAMVLTVFNACTKDDLPVGKPTGGELSSKNPDVYLENDYLAFKNMNAVDSVMYVLAQMTRTEKDVWEQKMGFKSARSEFDKLFDEYEKLTSKEEFLKFKAKHTAQLKFNEMDEEDCSIDYPYEETYFAPVMNSSGIFKVGMSLLKFTRENQITILDGDFVKLNNIENFANDNSIIVSTKLKSTTDEVTTNVTGFDGWIVEGNRKLWNDLNWTKILYMLSSAGDPFLSVRIVQIAYLRQEGRKKTVFGWAKYSTVYILGDSWYQEGSQPKKQIRTGIHESPETTPYYDWRLSTIEYTSNSSTSYYNAVRPDKMSFRGNVSFRGFSNSYLISYSEHSGF